MFLGWVCGFCPLPNLSEFAHRLWRYRTATVAESHLCLSALRLPPVMTSLVLAVKEIPPHNNFHQSYRWSNQHNTLYVYFTLCLRQLESKGQSLDSLLNGANQAPIRHLIVSTGFPRSSKEELIAKKSFFSFAVKIYFSCSTLLLNPQMHFPYKCSTIQGEINMLSWGIRFIAKKNCYNTNFLFLGARFRYGKIVHLVYIFVYTYIHIFLIQTCM